jgi:hypothetical protein
MQRETYTLGTDLKAALAPRGGSTAKAPAASSRC